MVDQKMGGVSRLKKGGHRARAPRRPLVLSVSIRHVPQTRRALLSRDLYIGLAPLYALADARAEDRLGDLERLRDLDARLLDRRVTLEQQARGHTARHANKTRHRRRAIRHTVVQQRARKRLFLAIFGHDTKAVL